MGYSLKVFTQVREALEQNGIKYKYRILNRSGAWDGRGFGRVNFGSAGLNMQFEHQYIISVKRDDAEKAKNLVDNPCAGSVQSF